MIKTGKEIRNFAIRAIASFSTVVCAVLIFGIGSAQAADFTVTSHDADSGPGRTLRQAILAANALPV